MRILYIGETVTHEQYLKGNVPSHWFYGAVEMERDGYDVIWSQEHSSLLNDIKLIRKYHPDIIFIPNLNIRNHLLLLIVVTLGFYRKPVYAYLHHEPVVSTGMKRRVYRFLFSGVSHLFFLSEKTLEKTVSEGIVPVRKCSVPGWGPDMDFFNKIPTSDNGWFVSTGKENRDFDTLIEAFRITGEPLHIITAKSHNGVSYEDLLEKTLKIPNIKVTVLDNSPTNYPFMVSEMASAKALVCPLKDTALNYCVGLSTIADAEGLGKPLIITDNPYHDDRPQADGFSQVRSVNEWIAAIESVDAVSASKYNMAGAYLNMKKYIPQLC